MNRVCPEKTGPGAESGRDFRRGNWRRGAACERVLVSGIPTGSGGWNERRGVFFRCDRDGLGVECYRTTRAGAGGLGGWLFAGFIGLATTGGRGILQRLGGNACGHAQNNYSGEDQSSHANRRGHTGNVMTDPGKSRGGTLHQAMAFRRIFSWAAVMRRALAGEVSSWPER